MPANPSGIKGISTLFSFTPRQVLLNTPTMKHGADNGTIISEQKVKFLLHQSIALYLEHSGFSKTLKKFISEAKIEKDNTEGSSVDLEEMCRKFLETCNDAKSTINGQKEQVAGVHSKNVEEKPKEKKKKKSKLVSEAADNMEDNQLESLPMVPENKVKDDLSTDAKVENGAETEKQSKRKTKKKDAKVENGAETEKRSKHKMKKKDKSKSEGDAKEQIEDTDAIVSEKENFEASNEEATPEAKKDSKKRKRPISKENGEQDTEIKADEETKRRKIENLNGETDVHLMSQCQKREREGNTMKIERKKILDEAKKQLWLAGPMILVCVFQNLQMTTLIFVGHLNQELLLAGASLALSIINVTDFNVLMGMSSALDTFCGQAYGAKQYHMVGIYTQRAMLVITLVSLPLSIIWAYLEPILIILHQDKDIAAQAQLFARYAIPSLFANGILIKHHLQSLDISKYCWAHLVLGDSLVTNLMMHTGYMLKKSGKGSGWSKRWFVLNEKSGKVSKFIDSEQI